VARAADLRRRLVDRLAIEDAAVRRAFLAVPRERFVPHVASLEEVYRDDVVIVKRDERGTPISSSSQPQIMARMLERLALEPGQRVLEIGAGTGYNAALLKEIVGPGGSVVTVDVDAELARSARRALKAGGHRVRVVVGDGRLGWPPGAPYDRIEATVSAAEIPLAWRDQLQDGGLLEVPLRFARGEQAVVTFRREGARLVSIAVIPGGFMPLRGTEPEPPPALWAGGTAGPLAQVVGTAVAMLSEAARRRLLAALLGPQRVVRVPPLPRSELRAALALELPDERFAESPRHGLGVVGRGGSGAAFADTTWQERTPTKRVVAFGEPEAERYLLRLLERVRETGLALRLAVEFDGETSRIVRL
jgi:protein-L-isoaspartate(D-aspartate) O-methyltransferase